MGRQFWKYCLSPLLRCIFSCWNPQKSPCVLMPMDQIMLNPKNALFVRGCVISLVATFEAGNTVIIGQIMKLVWACLDRIIIMVRKVLDSASTNVLYAYTSGKLKQAGLIPSNMYFRSSNQCYSPTPCRQQLTGAGLVRMAITGG
jgi:hypothetical protein